MLAQIGVLFDLINTGYEKLFRTRGARRGVGVYVRAAAFRHLWMTVIVPNS